MMPVGANGESDAGVRAVADHDRHQEQRDADAAAVAIAIGAISAAVAMLPGPSTRAPPPSTKNMIGITPRLPRQTPHGVVRELVERAVALRQREQQRHAGQRQEQLASGSRASRR